MNYNITNKIEYIGVNDKTLDLFESQYIIPNGVSYNSYIIKDKKNVLMDTVDKRATNEWLENVEKSLNGENIDYLVISHLEPDHSANIQLIAEKYPDINIDKEDFLKNTTLETNINLIIEGSSLVKNSL